MAENKETRPVSYRISAETQEKIQKIAQELGLNQQGTLQKLVESFELQRGKQAITDPGKKELIDTFDFYTSKLSTAFTGIVESLQEAEEKAKMEVASSLAAKETQIIELHQKVVTLKQDKEDAVQKAKDYADELESIRKSNTSLEAMLKDKENLNKALTDTSNELRAKVDSMSADHEKLAAAVKQVSTLTTAKTKLEAENKDLCKQLEAQKQHEADVLEQYAQKKDLEREKAVLAVEKGFQEQIQALKAEKQKEIDQYQQKYLELLEKMQSNTDKGVQ